MNKKEEWKPIAAAFFIVSEKSSWHTTLYIIKLVPQRSDAHFIFSFSPWSDQTRLWTLDLNHEGLIQFSAERLFLLKAPVEISAANERECSWRMNTHKRGAFQCIDSLFEKGTFRPDGNLRNPLTEPSNRSLPCVIRCEVNHYLSFLLPMGKGTCSFLDWPSRPEKTQGWESIQAATWVRQNHRSTRKWVRPWMRSNNNF